jgi:sugar phosphate permease
MTALANWFRRRVGIAIGIMASGHGFGGLLVPVVVRLVDMYEWRMAMAIFAVGMLVIGLPLSLLVRHKPEPYGYQPDGEVNGSVILDRGFTPVQTAEVSIGAKQAVKSSTFWHIALALACQFMMAGAVTTHVMPYLSSTGIARATSSLVASAMPLLSIIGRLGFGGLADRFDKRRITAGGFAMVSLSLLLFGYVGAGRIWLLVPFSILFGIGYGGVIIMRVALLREYFGRAKFGTIHGFVVGVMMLGNVVGAFLPGWVYDNWGSYQGVWLMFAGLAVAALIIVATTPPVRNIIQSSRLTN